MENTMRITNNLLYTNSIRNYRTASEKLYDVNQQIASGLKIQNSYEDTGIYVDTMRLNSELSSLEQASESSSKASSFATNTDSTLSDITEQLENFKTLLTQAANESNSTTSLEAIAVELETIYEQIKSLSNTSINGQYLFSGSALGTEPISSDGTYNGNGESLTAVVGSGLELAYNVDGESLFLGSDSEYTKTISTNVAMLNQTSLYPEVMDSSGTNSSSTEEYLTEDDTIRDMVGDTDSDATNDPDTVFYLSGRDADGETFSTKITMSSTSSVSDLLESIGSAYGNTSTNQVVDVTMNANGQIEVTDLTGGNNVIEMNLFAAVDRDAAAGTSGDADQNSVEDLVAQSNVDIIEFNASNYSTTNSASTIASRADTYESDIYYIGYPLEDSSGDAAESTTLLSDIMPSNVDSILVGATTLSVTATTTVQDLLNTISTETGGTARIEDGQLIVESTAAVSIQLTAQDATTTATAGFSIPDAANYTARGFEKDGNELTGNVSQVVIATNEYATATTKLSEVSGVDTLDGKSLTLDYTDKNGNSNTATINLSDAGSTVSVDLNGDGDTTDTDEIFTIYDGSGNVTAADDVTYQQLTDVISMLTSGSLPTDGVPAASTDYEEYNYALKTAASSVEVELDDEGKITILDKTSSESKIELSMYDSDTGDYSGTTSTALSFMANDAVTTESPSIDLFSQLEEMIEAVRSGTFRMDSESDDPRNMGIQNALAVIDHIADHVEKEHTKIGALSNALTSANETAETLTTSITTIQTDIVGVDLTEAYLEYTSISTSYQTMLSTISKVMSMSLADYM
ncbi:flagellar hook-associated protein FlgL [Sulfurospirillum halorespirans DSM 13726]|uniref:Flagellin n=2 Tax=Sulfurospirillum halorespirans TaxID=194424 RepID=A0A1D7TK03_9BACT|nr:flagellar hook-associated protein FlgL [Sulfurospirillum halorespirans DSM 13726]